MACHSCGANVQHSTERRRHWCHGKRPSTRHLLNDISAIQFWFLQIIIADISKIILTSPNCCAWCCSSEASHWILAKQSVRASAGVMAAAVVDKTLKQKGIKGFAANESFGFSVEMYNSQHRWEGGSLVHCFHHQLRKISCGSASWG